MTNNTRQEAVAWMYEDDYQRCLTSECSAKVYSVEQINVHTGNKTTVALYATPVLTPMTDEEIAHTLGWRTSEFLTAREKRDARKIEAFLQKRYS